uniref:Uncharacterized protein n=1 Tax=Glossina brevipalpis TaxID=37001 RepID=A0A1A9WSZ3_9MUSC
MIKLAVQYFYFIGKDLLMCTLLLLAFNLSTPPLPAIPPPPPLRPLLCQNCFDDLRRQIRTLNSPAICRQTLLAFFAGNIDIGLRPHSLSVAHSTSVSKMITSRTYSLFLGQEK